MTGISVSAVIPAFNAARTIRRAVDSALRQTYPPLEILVIDDGSDDPICRVLQPYGDRVTVIRKKNGGVSDARNLGIDLSQGELVAFLDADDYWEPVKLERQVRIFERNPGVGLVGACRFREAATGSRIAPSISIDGLMDRIIPPIGQNAFAIAMWISTPTVVVRRSALGDERFDTSLESAEDRDLWVRLVASTSVYLLSEPLATVVLEPNSLSRTCVDSDCESMLRVVRRYSGLLGRRGLHRWEAHVYRRWAGGRLDQGRAREAIGPACRRLCLDPFSLEAWWILLKSACRSALGTRRRERRVATEHSQQEARPLQQVRDV